ncbi:uncharacterized protein CDAR_265171 [Caerostris darwini]|uniref:Uncharacterized protein n=1 Tax=Caerostris darwini TaxID=1538125 RepID=A0AAV4W2T6_9ARAC|nr:uncharacterized protein CDAR_265171 [Caerostris darwini]
MDVADDPVPEQPRKLKIPPFFVLLPTRSSINEIDPISGQFSETEEDHMHLNSFALCLPEMEAFVIMSKRMALISPEFLIGHQRQKPEFRLEDELSRLLDSYQLPDDLKVKLLSQLHTRYQKSVHEPSAL